MLDGASVSWKYYSTKCQDAGFWEPFEAIKYVRYGSDWGPTHIVCPQTQVLKDASNGKLATVDWVTPEPRGFRPSRLSRRHRTFVGCVGRERDR